MLHGITDPGFSVLGDSISTLAGFIPAGWRVHYEGEVQVEGITEPRHTWWGQVIDHFGGHLTANSSFSGSCVEGFGFPGLKATAVGYTNGSLAVTAMLNGDVSYVIIDEAPAASITKAINAMQ